MAPGCRGTSTGTCSSPASRSSPAGWGKERTRFLLLDRMTKRSGVSLFLVFKCFLKNFCNFSKGNLDVQTATPSAIVRESEKDRTFGTFHSQDRVRTHRKCLFRDERMQFLFVSLEAVHKGEREKTCVTCDHGGRNHEDRENCETSPSSGSSWQRHLSSTYS